MIVVSNSSPLISLAKIDGFDLLQELYGKLLVSAEVYAEVVIQGSIAVLEACHRRGHIPDLRQAYRRMLQAGVYLDRDLLNRILTSLGLSPL